MKPTAESKLVLRVRKKLIGWVYASSYLLLSNIPVALSNIPFQVKLGYAVLTFGAVVLYFVPGSRFGEWSNSKHDLEAAASQAMRCRGFSSSHSV